MVAVITMLVACGRDPVVPTVEMDLPSDFSQPGSAELADRWWAAFDDPALDRRVEAALGANFDLRAAWERLAESRAILLRESGQRWPTLDATAGGTLARGGDDDGRDPDADVERLTLGLSATYEVDLWGRISAQIAAEEARLRASSADYRAAAITLSAEVALTWYRLLEARGQVELIASQVDANQQVLALLRGRFGGGQGRRVDVLRQEQLVASTRGDLATARAEVAALRHQLAVLQGRPPRDEPEPEARPLPQLAPTPRTGLPTELLRRRPDVRRAHHLLVAANRDLAAAVSDQYPRLAITASVDTVEDDLRDLFQNWIATLAANLIAPIIDGGRRAAEVERQEAVERQRLAEYGQAVLVALQEVETALARERHLRERLVSLERQQELADETIRRLRDEYLGGVTSYIEVLIALTSAQDLERELLRTRREMIEFRIALHRALAGGFETPLELEAAAEAEGQTREDTAP